jgi:hypothetical protein
MQEKVTFNKITKGPHLLHQSSMTRIFVSIAMGALLTSEKRVTKVQYQIRNRTATHVASPPIVEKPNETHQVRERLRLYLYS